MTDKQTFAGYVKDILNNFYAAGKLEDSPLVQALRQTMREALAALKPADQVPFGSAEWLGHRIMWTRYVSARSQAATCAELGISSSTYYRYHREAMDGLVQALWCRYQKLERTLDDLSSDSSVSAYCDASHEAVRLARTSRRQCIDLDIFLPELLRTIQPLAEQVQISLQLKTPKPLPSPFVDPGLLNQIVLSALSEALYLARGPVLDLCVSTGGRGSIWRLEPLNVQQFLAVGGVATPGLEPARTLIEAYGGQMWLEHGADVASLCFSLPVARPPLVMVIDDDQDMGRLYGVYLQSLGVMLKNVNNSEQLQQQLAEATPDLVLLDILMPQWDGWRILRDLKEAPQTAAVPVVVCSVLTQPRLALALGAERVLQKPINPTVLVETAQDLLAL